MSILTSSDLHFYLNWDCRPLRVTNVSSTVPSSVAEWCRHQTFKSNQNKWEWCAVGCDSSLESPSLFELIPSPGQEILSYSQDLCWWLILRVASHLVCESWVLSLDNYPFIWKEQQTACDRIALKIIALCTTIIAMPLNWFPTIRAIFAMVFKTVSVEQQ